MSIKASLSCQEISSHSTWACINVRHRSRRHRTCRPLVLWCSDLTLLRLVVTCYEIDGYTYVERAAYQRACVMFGLGRRAGMFGDWHCGGCLAFIHRRSAKCANVFKRRLREGGRHAWARGDGRGKEEQDSRSEGASNVND